MSQVFLRPPENQAKTRKLILVIPGVSIFLKRVLLRFALNTYGTFTLFILPALTPPSYSIKIFSQKLFWFDRDFEGGALVGVSCATSNVREGYRIADRFRRAGSVVVLGGIHVSCLPEEALEHADAVVIGEAESVWPEVIRDYENGPLKRIYRGQPLDDYFSPSYPYFLTIDPKLLSRTGLLLSRGCKYQCEFCAPHEKKVRFIKLEQATELIRRVAQACKSSFNKRPIILLQDDNVFSDPERAKDLFKAMIPMKVRWLGNSSIDIAFDEEALRLARESGCGLLFVGFESIYPRTLPKTSVGHMTRAEDYLQPIRKMRSYGIKVMGAFILGLDHCTHKYYLELIWFLIRARLDYVSLTILTPFPGSPVYERLKAENRIITYDWRKYDGVFRVVFQPRHMSVTALYLWFIVIRIVGFLASSFFQMFLLTFIMLFYIVFPLLRHILHRM
jgi:radical SAM superfamily enzyme YgiQ (UPF0313 family)